MQGALLDTSIYISALRQGDRAILALRQLAGDNPLWLSAVVLAELYAGADVAQRRAVEKLEHDFDGGRRTVVPNLRDWTLAGKVLSMLGAKYGYESVGRQRLMYDALIATSAGRLGIKVLSANYRDFSKLAEFCPFQWQIATL